ncbi:magnesium chelatase subunit ChlI family protein, partial [Halochromatium sp.]
PQRLRQQAMQPLALSARAYHRILKVARTIADLGEREQISLADLSEAIGYRKLDRESPQQPQLPPTRAHRGKA